MVTIDQLPCIGPDLITNPLTSLNGSYMQSVSPLPQVNYVVLSPMPSATDEDEPVTVRSASYDIDSVVDMVISSVRILEPSLLTPVATLDMCSFQSVVLSSSEDPLESMT
jgi:hypothetical protein